MLGSCWGCSACRINEKHPVWRQVWIGTKQKELEAGSMQLMHQYTPWATGVLAVLVPVFEPVGFTDPAPGTILGFTYTFASVTAIAGSAVSASLLCRNAN